MENNKFLYVIFTICVVILVLLIVQMFLVIPAVMHGDHGHHPQPMCTSPQTQAPNQAQAPAQFQQVQAGFPGFPPCPAPFSMHKCGPGFGGPGFHHPFHGKPMMPPKHLGPKPGDKPMPGQPGPKPGPKAPAEPQKNK